jgi:hypothetical protein
MSLSVHTLKYIKKYQKIYKKVISVARQSENDRIVKRSVKNTKTLWQIIKKESGNSFTEIENISLEIDSELVMDQQDVSQKFNEFFINSVDKLIHLNKNRKIDHSTTNDVIQNPNVLFLVPVTEEEVLQVTSKLKTKTSAGYDEIPDMIVKQCIQFIKKPLTFIFNLSLSSGIFPDQMKIAKVRPIFKKGQKQNIANYRPISILSVFSKILETLMYNRVENFLHKFNLISNAQNGFRKKKSTLTAIQTFIGEIQKTLDNKQLAFGIFLDLTKAFDVINHNLLLAKLEYYCLKGFSHVCM